MSDRMRRVDEVVRAVVSEGLREMADPGLGFVTVTGVRVTKELETATVYVQVLGDETRRERGMQALDRTRGALQARLGRELSLRRTPTLRFVYDESLDRALRLDELLAEHEPMVEQPDAEPEP